MNRLVLAGVAICLVAFFGFRWWNGRDGKFEAHLSLGRAECTQSAAIARACRQLRAHPLQIGLNDGHDATPVLTADAAGDVSASVPPGDYEVSWSDGDMGLRTNKGTRSIHIGPGRTVYAGEVRPDAGALFVVGKG